MTMKKNQTTEPTAWLKGCVGIANYAGVSHRTAQVWISDGLPARRLSARLLLVRPEDVDAFIERKAEERNSKRSN